MVEEPKQITDASEIPALLDEYLPKKHHMTQMLDKLGFRRKTTHYSGDGPNTNHLYGYYIHLWGLTRDEFPIKMQDNSEPDNSKLSSCVKKINERYQTLNPPPARTLIETNDNHLYIQRDSIPVLLTIERTMWQVFAVAVLETQKLLEQRRSSLEEVRQKLNKMLGVQFRYNENVVAFPQTPDDFMLELNAYHLDETSATRRAMYGKLIVENLPAEIKELFGIRERGKGYGDVVGDQGLLVQINVGNAKKLLEFLEKPKQQQTKTNTQQIFQKPGNLFEEFVFPSVLQNIETLIETTKEKKLIETAGVFEATMIAMDKEKNPNSLRQYEDQSAQEATKQKKIADLDKQIEKAWQNLVMILELKNVGNLRIDARTFEFVKDDQLGQFSDATQNVKLPNITNEKLTLAQYVERTATERAGEEMARLFQGRASEAGSMAGTTGNLSGLQKLIIVNPPGSF